MVRSERLQSTMGRHGHRSHLFQRVVRRSPPFEDDAAPGKTNTTSVSRDPELIKGGGGKGGRDVGAEMPTGSFRRLSPSFVWAQLLASQLWTKELRAERCHTSLGYR